MIITIAGNAGSGKSTVAKELVRVLHYKHYSTGDFMRQMAKERCVDLLALNKIAEQDASLDKSIDTWSSNLGKTHDNFVIDSRLAFHFIPHAFKVFLVADFDVRAQRIFSAKRVAEQHKTLAALKKYITEREASELKRYKKLYGLDYYNIKNYDLVIDTSTLSVKEIVAKIFTEFQRKRKKV